MSKFSAVHFVWILIVLQLGCSARRTSPSRPDGAPADSYTRPDHSPPPPPPPRLDLGRDSWGPDQGPLPIDCAAATCQDYVFSRFLLATSPQMAQQFGFDFNGDSVEDNALGAVLSALASVSSSFAAQPRLDHRVHTGQPIFLLRVQAANLVNQPQVSGQTWLGKPTACCAGKEGDPAACALEAQAGCFGGSGRFEPASPPALLAGKIAGGNLLLGSGTVRVQIPISATALLDVTLRSARIRGKIDAGGIFSGALGGVVPKTELTNTVVPALAQLLADALADPTIDPSSKKQIKDLFDKDGDGLVSTAEVANNELIKTFLSGDVDIDKDGKPELSLGIGFEAVRANILAP